MRSEERQYYDRLAPDYDDWALARGRYAGNEPPGWRRELGRLLVAVSDLEPGRILDVGCGTGIFTAVLPGEVVGLDQSERMLAVARRRCPDARFVLGDALAMPFPDQSFDLVFAAHLYSHLRRAARARFLAEAARVGRELVVVDSALRPSGAEEGLQNRTLPDGTSRPVYKRFFRPDDLARELGGDVLFAGEWFVAARRGSARR
jgi:ubiquinone/menaquinone biosynthesis C-methylase UbiE